MVASSPKAMKASAAFGKKIVLRKERSSEKRSNEIRAHAPVRPRQQLQQQQLQQQQIMLEQSRPAAGAHAAPHLVNEDATPGAGALPSYAHCSGKEVDGGAG